MASSSLTNHLAIFVAYFWRLVLIGNLLLGRDSSMALSDFTYGYEAEEFTLAYVNVTSIDLGSKTIVANRKEVGKFGFGRISPVAGLLVKITSADGKSLDACEPIKASLWPSEPWIAFARNGPCGDVHQLKNIFDTNASAAIIYENKLVARLDKMHTKAFNHISVLIPKAAGDEIAAYFENGSKVFVHLSVGPSTSQRYANINRTSVLFVSVSFIILMIISLAWLIFYYVQRFRYIHAKDILARRLCNAAKKVLEKIPTKTLRQPDIASLAQAEFAECCAVCIESFRVADLVRILPCRHVFHKSCVDPWLLDQRSCPMCKLDILKHYGLSLVAGSQESVYNVDELEAHLPSSTSSSHWRERRTRRASGDVQVIHVPITSSTSSSGHTASRSSRTRHVLTSSSVGRLPVSPTTSSSESGAGGESTGLPPVTSSINVSISIETRPTLTGTSTTTVSSGHGGKPTTSCSVLSFASSKLSPCSQKSLVLTSPDKVRPLVVAQETKYLPN